MVAWGIFTPYPSEVTCLLLIYTSHFNTRFGPPRPHLITRCLFFLKSHGPSPGLGSLRLRGSKQPARRTFDPLSALE